MKQLRRKKKPPKRALALIRLARLRRGKGARNGASTQEDRCLPQPAI